MAQKRSKRSPSLLVGEGAGGWGVYFNSVRWLTRCGWTQSFQICPLLSPCDGEGPGVELKSRT